MTRLGTEVIDGLGRVRLYDAGPKFADRYTILFMDTPTEKGMFAGIAFGDNVGPNGFSQYIECHPLQTYGRGSTHRRIAFDSLSPHLQAHLRWRVQPDPRERYGSPEHKFWLMEMEAREP